MAVKLRLARVGKRNQPYYRLIAIDEHKKAQGAAIETLGSYDPRNTQNRLEVKKDRLTYWLSVGAQPSATVKNLLRL